ncbi:GAG-pre-integrase domain - like 10 [Theobroma cacao]|nr:GAG-pre-integrase domain - like 10 [Theobroma cacao]
MSIYIRAIDNEMWNVITDGPFMPSTMNVVTNELMPKPRSEWTEAETKKVQINFKAINTLHCALTPTEFNKVSSCTTAKQVWEKLRIIHEGTSQVKESKIALLTHNYEMFKMEHGEDITSMFDRFTNITNKLSQLGKPILEHELICGSLLTHELELKEEEEEDQRKAKEKKKSIALKANILEEELEELSCDDDEKLALVARKFRKLMSRRNRRLTRIGFRKDQGSSWKNRNKIDSNKKEELICYECKKLGHIKFECPLLKDETLKKNKKSKRAMVAAAWSDSETSSSEAEDEKSKERANICLMAQDDETEVELDLKEACSRAQLKKKQPWYMDSGCSRHMTGHEMLFAQLDKRNGGTVSFGDDFKGRIHGISTVGFLEDLEVNSEVCLVANAENDSWLWHRRLEHVSLHTMSKLIKKNLVAGLPELKFENYRICDACQLGKQVRTSFKSKKTVSIARPLELLHIDLFGPISTTSLRGKSYGFVIVNDYSRYTWVYFLAHKNDAYQPS